ncbi:unnamed protein product [Dracunculus medinensis]|uniref:6 kDa protein n=1 Tax=Dracunculus medinensis TaxID=318479 RepID=A0A0N4U2R4_DRAME|nr:unnamed protein product [Dracunculus medinensis]
MDGWQGYDTILCGLQVCPYETAFYYYYCCSGLFGLGGCCYSLKAWVIVLIIILVILFLACAAGCIGILLYRQSSRRNEHG